MKQSINKTEKVESAINNIEYMGKLLLLHIFGIAILMLVTVGIVTIVQLFIEDDYAYISTRSLRENQLELEARIENLENLRTKDDIPEVE